MNIEEAISQISKAPEGVVLVAKSPLTWGADALFVELTEDCRVPDSVKQAGYEYLLGREDIEHLLADLKKKKVSSRTVAEFIIHYAMNDCAPAWIDDVPDA